MLFSRKTDVKSGQAECNSLGGLWPPGDGGNVIARPAIYPWAVKGPHVCRAFWPTVPHLPDARQSPAR